MGDYEDRYPEVYGQPEPSQPNAPREPIQQSPPRQGPSLRGFFGGGAQPERSPVWRQAPSAAPAPPEAEPRQVVEPVAAPGRYSGTHRGIGPRGYRRSPQRIFEDICDRLTENPFIDASDMEVSVTGAEITLSGSVENDIALRQAEAIAAEVVGVSHVHNRLRVRAGERREPSPGDQVNRAMGATRR